MDFSYVYEIQLNFWKLVEFSEIWLVVIILVDFWFLPGGLQEAPGGGPEGRQPGPRGNREGAKSVYIYNELLKESMVYPKGIR